MIKLIEIKEYKKVLEELEELKENKGQCHLLLGNGFNSSLGIATGYKNIYGRMIKREPIYEKNLLLCHKKIYDIEHIIEDLTKLPPLFKGQESKFLEKYIKKKVKLDCMQAISDIASKNITKIYKESNNEIYKLFKNIDKFFTLNYDTFLYLLLLQFMKSKSELTQELPSSNSLGLLDPSLDENYIKLIYILIKELYDSGKLTIEIDNKNISVNIQQIPKISFQKIVQMYFKKKKDLNFTVEFIKIACDRLWDEKNQEKKLKEINDGFNKYGYSPSSEQKIFFLHGSLHIFIDGNIENGEPEIKKITQTQNKAFSERLAEIVSIAKEEIIFILSAYSEDKLIEIGENDYTKEALAQLSSISGSLVIFGSSLDDNDKHIFEAIDNSSVDVIYISRCSESMEKDKDKEKVEKLFDTNKKRIALFDYNDVKFRSKNANNKAAKK